MDLSHHILNQFEEHLMATQQAIEEVSNAMAMSAEAIVQTLIHDGKVFVTGSREGKYIAQRLCDCLLFGLERERPALPANFLPSHKPDTSSNFLHARSNSVAQQINAFATANDILVIVTVDGNSATLKNAVQAAQDKGMITVSLTGRDGGIISEILSDKDIEIQVSNASVSRISEIQWFIAHCLTDLVDNMLFGTEN